MTTAHRLSRLTRLSVTACLTALVALVGMVGTSAPASAYTWVDTQGRPGFVQLSKAQGVHIRQCSTYAYYTCRMAPGIHVPAQRVNRSPRTSGRQDLGVAIVIQRYEGDRWVRQTSRTWYGRIPAGVRSIRMPEWTVLPNRVNYLRVQVAVAWARPAGGALGARMITMNQLGDYECATTLRPCEAGPGWLFIREPGV